MEKKARILLVDDDPDQLLLLSAFLERENFEVVTVDTAKNGLNTLHETQVDIVITDISMPEMDGLEFSSELKKRHKEVPIILLTAGLHPINFSEKNFKADAFCMKHDLKRGLISAIHSLVD